VRLFRSATTCLTSAISRSSETPSARAQYSAVQSSRWTAFLLLCDIQLTRKRKSQGEPSPWARRLTELVAPAQPAVQSRRGAWLRQSGRAGLLDWCARSRGCRCGSARRGRLTRTAPLGLVRFNRKPAGGWSRPCPNGWSSVSRPHGNRPDRGSSDSRPCRRHGRRSIPD